jgi:hypothetical protein
VGVEPTIRPAKDRIAGFEDREGHRTPFASAACKTIRLQSLLNVYNFGPFDLWLRSVRINFESLASSIAHDTATAITASPDLLDSQ